MTRDRKSSIGRPVGSRRLSKHEREAILARLKAGESVPDIARATGISQTAVRTIRGVTPRKVVAKPVVKAAWTLEDEWRARARSLRWGDGAWS
jgi:DNA-binding NarL/FixJ family response regulator